MLADKFQLKLHSLREAGDHLSEASLEVEDDETVDTENSFREELEGTGQRGNRPSLESVEEISEEIPEDDEEEAEEVAEEQLQSSSVGADKECLGGVRWKRVGKLFSCHISSSL